MYTHMLCVSICTYAAVSPRELAVLSWSLSEPGSDVTDTYHVLNLSAGNALSLAVFWTPPKKVKL